MRGNQGKERKGEWEGQENGKKEDQTRPLQSRQSKEIKGKLMETRRNS